jgi:CBS domain-containing protein
MKVGDVMQRRVTVVNEEDTLALARQLMRWTEIRHLPVIQTGTGRVIGVLSDRELVRAAVEAEATPLAMNRPVRELMATPVEHIHPNAELADAAADMTVKKLGCLPVLDAGQLVGIITRADVLSVLAQYPAGYRTEKPQLRPPLAASIMYPEPVAVRPSELLLTAAGRMATAHVRHACVVDGEGQVIGLLSDRDVRRVIGDPLRALEVERLPDAVRELRVEPVMSRNPKTIDQDEPFTNALPLLVNERLGAVPVVDRRGRLRGILSYVDVLKALAMYIPSASEE